MRDRIEKFVKKHRAEMDAAEPRPDLWIDIANEMSGKQKVRKLNRSFVIWRAAAVLLLAVTSWLVFDKYVEKPVQEQPISMTRELKEAESFFVMQIADKSREVELLTGALAIETGFGNEIAMLDSAYLALKDNLGYGNQEEVADAMILNLQLRIEILNRQLQIIQIIREKSKNKLNGNEMSI